MCACAVCMCTSLDCMCVYFLMPCKHSVVDALARIRRMALNINKNASQTALYGICVGWAVPATAMTAGVAIPSDLYYYYLRQKHEFHGSHSIIYLYMYLIPAVL